METKQKTLEDDLNNALAYSYVLGWYAGSDGVKTDKGKWQHDHMKQAAEDIEDIKADHPGIVQACNAHEDLLEACEEAEGFITRVLQSVPEKMEIGKALANAVLDQAADGLDRTDYILGLASTLLEPTEIENMDSKRA